MRHMKQRMRLLTALMVILISGLLCSCDSGEEQKEIREFPTTLETVATGTVAENSRFSLEWDNEKFCVLLRQKDSEKYGRLFHMIFTRQQRQVRI